MVGKLFFPEETMTMSKAHSTFIGRLRGLLPKRHLALIDLAYTLAKHAYRYGKRDGERDLGRIAIIIIDEAGVREITTIVAALLHDAARGRRGTLDVSKLEPLFGPDVGRVIDMVADAAPKPLGGDMDWRALLVKAAEQLDVLRSLGTMDEAGVRRLIKETKEKHLPLLERLLSLAPRRYARGVRFIRDAIIAIVSEYDEKRVPKRR